MRVTFTHLVGPKKGSSEEFEAAIITVGRAPDNLLCLGDGARRVSSHHAEVIRRGDGFLLRDLGSTNGTMINGRRVVVGELNHDDMIEFGAGGPLIRFAVEQADSVASQSDKAQPEAAKGPARSGKTSAVGSRKDERRRANATLIAAITIAMLAGAWGGVLLSSRSGVSSPEPMSFSEVAELNSPAVVFIRVEYELIESDGRIMPAAARTGSGFVISQDGLIVTNRHLVRDWEYNKPHAGASGRATKIEVFFPSWRRDQAIPAQVEKLAATTDKDVAILRVNPEHLPVVHAVEPDLKRISQGEEVTVIGYPLGLELLDLTNDRKVAPSLSTGIVSRVGDDLIQLQLRAYRGNSGGPVLNRRGQAIAILTANVGSAEDITIATPISAALELIANQ
jgi:serine protease Do